MLSTASSIPAKMKALRCEKAGVDYYSLQEVPLPDPSGYRALVQIHAAGLCHTDMMLMDGTFKNPKLSYPATGSHEPSGVVVALGDKAEKEDIIKVGTRVAGFLHIDICGECLDCKTGKTQYCPNSLYTGLTADGAFAEYELLDSRLLVPIPDSMSFEQAAPLTCAGITIYSAIKKANLKPGQVIAIIGLGALGHLGVQMAKVMGLKVVGVDARPEPIAMSKKLKHPPDVCVDARSIKAETTVKEIKKLRPPGYEGWEGADATLITSDPVESQRYACDITRRHGLIVMVSQPPKIEFDYVDFIFKDLTVVGTLHGTKEELQECVNLCAEHGIMSDVTTYKMEQHKEMVDSVHADGRKGKTVMVI